MQIHDGPEAQQTSHVNFHSFFHFFRRASRGYPHEWKLFQQPDPDELPTASTSHRRHFDSCSSKTYTAIKYTQVNSDCVPVFPYLKCELCFIVSQNEEIYFSIFAHPPSQYVKVLLKNYENNIFPCENWQKYP